MIFITHKFYFFLLKIYAMKNYGDLKKCVEGRKEKLVLFLGCLLSIKLFMIKIGKNLIEFINNINLLFLLKIK